jgi:hypothetical protein
MLLKAWLLLKLARLACDGCLATDGAVVGETDSTHLLLCITLTFYSWGLDWTLADAPSTPGRTLHFCDSATLQLCIQASGAAVVPSSDKLRPLLNDQCGFGHGKQAPLSEGPTVGIPLPLATLWHSCRQLRRVKPPSPPIKRGPQDLPVPTARALPVARPGATPRSSPQVTSSCLETLSLVLTRSLPVFLYL